MSKPWLNELNAVMHLRDRAWHKISGAIAIRMRDIRHQVVELERLATDATMGRDTIDQMRAAYRDLQKFTRLLCETAMGYRDAHRELGSIKPPRALPDDSPDVVLPVLTAARWYPEKPTT